MYRLLSSIAKNLTWIALGVLMVVQYAGAQMSLGSVPTFRNNFAKHLTDNTPNRDGEVTTVYDLGIKWEKSLAENIRILFYPDISGRGGVLRDVIRTVGFALLVGFIVWAGIQMVRNGDEESKIYSARMSLVYILFGAIIFFGVTRILGTALRIGTVGGTETLVSNLQNNLLFQVLSFLKAAAFFVAIIMMIYYGFLMMRAFEKEDKINQAKKGIINVILALVFIKIIDYLYFVAQSQTFVSQATDFIVQVSKAMGYILGILFMLSIFYAGFRLVTSNGDEEELAKAKNIILTIFLSSIVIFMFLLIVYQIFNEFAG